MRVFNSKCVSILGCVHHISYTTSAPSSPNVFYTKTISCIEWNISVYCIILQCASIYQIDLTPIRTCAESVRGVNLFVGHGNQTGTIGLTFVPSIGIDQVCIVYINSNMRIEYSPYTSLFIQNCV